MFVLPSWLFLNFILFFQCDTAMSDRETMSEESVARKRNYIVDLLVVLFGIGSWIGVTSAYVQVPLIIQPAPEGWSLSSQMSITVQSASIVSLIYVLSQNYFRGKFNVTPFIYVTMIIGCGATLSMSLMYQHTTTILGNQHSVAWLVNTFLFALVGCLSSVMFMPYMGRFREIYLVTYIFGQGFNGIPASILAFIQGIGGPTTCIPNNSTDGPAFIEDIPKPLFGPNIFFLVIFAIMILSTLAFFLLNKLKICKNELAVGDVLRGNDYCYDKIEKDRECSVPIPDDVKNLSKSNFIYLIATEATLNCIGNGLFPGLQIFSSLPYGNWPYHLTVNLSAISNPIACFVAMLVPRTSICRIRQLSVFSVILAAYIIFIALKSPNPPMIHSIIGPTLIVSKKKEISLPIVEKTMKCKHRAEQLVFLIIICLDTVLDSILCEHKFHENVHHINISIPGGKIVGINRNNQSNECRYWSDHRIYVS